MWMGRRLAGVVLASGLGMAGTGRVAAESAPAASNYELVRGAAQDACAQAIVRMRAAVPETLVAVRSVGTSGGNFLVENALQSALTAVRFRPVSSVKPKGGER